MAPAPTGEGEGLDEQEHHDQRAVGLESITDFDAGGLIPPINITAEDHGGGGKTRVEMWDGEKWISETDWMSAYDDAIWDVVREYSSKFATENE